VSKNMRAHRKIHLQEAGVKTFHKAGVYTYRVPLNQKSLKIQIWGAGGGSGHLKNQGHGEGTGGSFVECVVDVFPGEELTVTVGDGGKKGQYGNGHDRGIGIGGKPGGGDGFSKYVQWACGGGGGFSCIQRNAPTGGLELVVLAAGGGGGAHPLFTEETGGASGDQKEGGSGGGPEDMIVSGDVYATGQGQNGKAFQGGNGSLIGGGGGGGFFGGGGGGFIPGFAGRGGRGSNYVFSLSDDSEKEKEEKKKKEDEKKREFSRVARDVVSEHANSMQPAGMSRKPPKAIGAFVWDELEMLAGTGGKSSPKACYDGACGAVRIICRQSRRGKWWM